MEGAQDQTGLASSDWSERKASVLELGQSASELDANAINKLWELVRNDSDYDVRAAAITVLAASKDASVADYLFENVAIDVHALRTGVAAGLAANPELITPPKVEVVLRALAQEPDRSIQIALARAIYGATDADRVAARAQELLKGTYLSSVRAGAFLSLLISGGTASDELASAIDEACARMGGAYEALELDSQLLRWAPSFWDLLNEYLLGDRVSDLRASVVGMWQDSRSGLNFDDPAGWAKFAMKLAGGLRESRPEDGYAPPDIWGATYSQDLVARFAADIDWEAPADPRWPNSAGAWLERNVDQFRAIPDLDGLVVALWEVLPRHSNLMVVLLELAGVKRVMDLAAGSLDALSTEERIGVGQALLLAESGRFLEELRDNTDTTVPFVVAMLKSHEWNARMDAAKWITLRASRLPGEVVTSLIETLTTLRDEDQDADVQLHAREALVELAGRRRKLNIQPLVDRLQGDDEETAHQALEQLDDQGTPEAARGIVDAWIAWLARGRQGTLVDTTADLLRRNPHCVLPLLNHLSARLDLTPELEFSIREELIPSDIRAILERNRESRQVDDESRFRLNRWLRSTRAGVAKSDAVSRAENVDIDELDSLVAEEVEERRAQREGAVHRRLSMLMVEMSEDRFFDEDPEVYQRVAKQLKMHAVPTLSHLLSTEGNVEVRENVARVLGNIGGRSAVDALARAVSGEERTRGRRQELLSTYYLEPSKKQGDQASRILTTAVADARRTLRVLQLLNFVFAAIGLGFLVTGLYLILFTSDQTLQFAGGVISVSAFFALLLQVIREPLDRIQDSMNRLVQVETAFTSFIWELNLNSTFIQSQYVANGVLSTAEIGDTIDRIEGAMRLSMDLVSSYADQYAETRIAPSLLSVSPGLLKPGERIRLRGSWLGGARSVKGSQGVSVLIDHQVVKSHVLSASDSTVEFRLPEGDVLFAAGSTGTHWLSLDVGGKETNALPVHVNPA